MLADLALNDRVTVNIIDDTLGAHLDLNGHTARIVNVQEWVYPYTLEFENPTIQELYLEKYAPRQFDDIEVTKID